ncbi:hypothetical protein HYH03_000692 [Edaphochlamys debaryana]|uniref:SCP domain-containing protein n=1 Tax=Edaphochlamys debaryana TaxID=47281 RepID=A0A835YJP0_9CHLO|nr:hypothetical protein HYH03_000692 [Edaphochlamys debaryana]|eukprot:KAG2502206.1 hypothetical protein HYH03_000692 [Edaphochlamys debaryana]
MPATLPLGPAWQGGGTSGVDGEEQPPSPPAPSAGGGLLLGGGNCPDAQAVLDRTNQYRAWHQAPPLQWSRTLAAASLQYAKQLAARKCELVHGAYGENLQRVGGFPKPDDKCLVAIDAWYDELQYYDFNAKDLYRDNWGKMIGHFTQLVWRSSTTVGCAMASANTPVTFPGGSKVMGGCKVIVCRYEPYGNWADGGYFSRNVWPREDA